MTGSGTVYLTGQNTYTGPTDVESGTLSMAYASAQGTITVSAGATFIVPAGASLANSLVNYGTVDLYGAWSISGSGSIYNYAGGSLAVNSGGTLTTAANSELDNFGSVNNTSGGSLTIGGYMDIEDGATVTGNLVTSSTGDLITDQENAPMTCGVNVSGSGSVYDEGMNTLNLTGNITGSVTVYMYACGSMTLSGNNNFAELINLEGGGAVLVVGSANALGPSNVSPGIDIAGGVINLNGYSVTLDDLIGPQGCGYITDDSSGSGTTTLTINNTGTQTFGGIIENGPSKTIALVKQGTGTLILTAANTFTGTTTISGGTLQLGNGTTNGSIQHSASIVDNAILEYMETGSLTPGQNLTGSGAMIDDDLLGVLAYANLHSGFTGTHSNIGGGTMTW